MNRARGRGGLAFAFAAALGVALVGDVSANENNGTTRHGSGKDRPGYCDPTFCPETTEPAQSHGTALYGEPGSTRRAQPEPGGGSGSKATTALNSNPPQAAGDNVGYPDERAADPAAGGGPFYQCI